jgi:hypothetical protein
MIATFLPVRSRDVFKRSRRRLIIVSRWGCVDLEKRVIKIKNNIVGREAKGPKDDSFGEGMIADQLADVLLEPQKETPYKGASDFVIYNEAGRGKPANDMISRRGAREYRKSRMG